MAGTVWNTFSAGQTTSAAKMNENFDWIEQHLIPQTGGSQTSGSFDLGSAAFQWKNCWVRAVTINGSRWTFIGDSIDLNSGTLRVKSSAVRGSTANSGGSAQEISQGTISTPDIRANAVTVISNSGSGTQAT